MDDRPRILIVGAGIAGLTLAAGFERHGITPTIIEIADGLLTRGLGLFLTSNVFLALRRIGLDQTVIERGFVIEQQVQTDSSNTPNNYHDFRPFNARYACNIGIAREGLMTGLLSGVRARIRHSNTIVSLEQTANGVAVEFSDGSSDTYDLVIGADGINSAVRKLVFGGIEPSYRSFCAWRTLLDCSESDATLTIRVAPGLALGSFSVGATMTYAFILAHYTEPPSLSRSEHLERMKELARSFRGSVPSLIQQQSDPTRVVFVPVGEVDTVPYYRERVVVIGDAAHAFPPQFAQGAAMAIEDAVVLAEILATSSDIDFALRSFESKRRPRVDRVRAAIRHRAILQGMEGPVTPELLARHPPVFPSSQAIYESLVEDIF